MTKKSNNLRKARFGATSTEMAIVIPVILLFVFGLIEWGRFEMMRQASSTAAFYAARTGSIPGSISETAEQQLSLIHISEPTRPY